VEFFRSVNVDWLGKKWYFLAFSLIFSVAGIVSMGMHWAKIGSPVPLGVDFRGGTQVQVQFAQAPDMTRIRQAMDATGVKDASIQTIQNIDEARGNEVLIGLPEQTNENALDAGRQQIVNALQAHYNDPFTIRNVQVVGPTVGKQLERQALLATLYSMAGMLVYLWFRFQLIYGVAAVVACFHDLCADQPGDQPDRDCGHSDAGGLFHERHHCRFRPHSRESAPEPAGGIAGRGEPQHQPDAEPDGAYVGTYLPDCAIVVRLRRPGVARLLFCAGGGHFDRHVFVDCRSLADAGGVAGVARREGQEHGSAPRKARSRVAVLPGDFAGFVSRFASDAQF
jgi:hypothetical protein